MLVGRMGTRAWAIPIEHVVETMRSLPIEPLVDAPQFVLGLSIIRGSPTVVIDLARLLDPVAGSTASRFVSMRIGARYAALAVEADLGVRTIAVADLNELPPLLQKPAGDDAIERIGRLDSHLLLVLSAARLIPETAWAALAQSTVAAAT